MLGDAARTSCNGNRKGIEGDAMYKIRINDKKNNKTIYVDCDDLNDAKIKFLKTIYDYDNGHMEFVNEFKVYEYGYDNCSDTEIIAIIEIIHDIVAEKEKLFENKHTAIVEYINKIIKIKTTFSFHELTTIKNNIDDLIELNEELEKAKNEN